MEKVLPAVSRPPTSVPGISQPFFSFLFYCCFLTAGLLHFYLFFAHFASLLFVTNGLRRFEAYFSVLFCLTASEIRLAGLVVAPCLSFVVSKVVYV